MKKFALFFSCLFTPYLVSMEELENPTRLKISNHTHFYIGYSIKEYNKHNTKTITRGSNISIGKHKDGSIDIITQKKTRSVNMYLILAQSLYRTKQTCQYIKVNFGKTINYKDTLIFTPKKTSILISNSNNNTIAELPYNQPKLEIGTISEILQNQQPLTLTISNKNLTEITVENIGYQKPIPFSYSLIKAIKPGVANPTTKSLINFSKQSSIRTSTLYKIRCDNNETLTSYTKNNYDEITHSALRITVPQALQQVEFLLNSANIKNNDILSVKLSNDKSQVIISNQDKKELAKLPTCLEIGK